MFLSMLERYHSVEFSTESTLELFARLDVVTGNDLSEAERQTYAPPAMNTYHVLKLTLLETYCKEYGNVFHDSVNDQV